MSLTEEDKKRIQEEERYRAEVRAKAEKPKGMGCGGGCLGLIIIGFLFVVYVAKTSSPTTSKSSSTFSSLPEPTRSPEEIAAAIETEKRRLGLVWQYEETEESMGRGKVQYATINSTNEFEFDFPYKGKQRATLTLRTHPKHGKDVILRIERGQFLCGVSDCSVAIKFDEQKPKSLSASESADHSTTVLFINGFSTLTGGLKSAKTLLIEAPIYQEGNQIFEFEVAGFNWPALQAKSTKK